MVMAETGSLGVWLLMFLLCYYGRTRNRQLEVSFMLLWEKQAALVLLMFLLLRQKQAALAFLILFVTLLWQKLAALMLLMFLLCCYGRSRQP